MFDHILHAKMVTKNALRSAGGSHGVIHSFLDRHPPCRVPCVLICLHDVVDPSIPTISIRISLIGQQNRFFLTHLFASAQAAKHVLKEEPH